MCLVHLLRGQNISFLSMSHSSASTPQVVFPPLPNWVYFFTLGSFVTNRELSNRSFPVCQCTEYPDQGAYFLASAIDMGCAEWCWAAAAGRHGKINEDRLFPRTFPLFKRTYLHKVPTLDAESTTLRAVSRAGGECIDAGPLRMGVDTVLDIALWTRSKCLNILCVSASIELRVWFRAGPTWWIRNWQPTIKLLLKRAT